MLGVVVGWGRGVWSGGGVSVWSGCVVRLCGQGVWSDLLSAPGGNSLGCEPQHLREQLAVFVPAQQHPVGGGGGDAWGEHRLMEGLLERLGPWRGERVRRKESGRVCRNTDLTTCQQGKETATFAFSSSLLLHQVQLQVFRD